MFGKQSRGAWSIGRSVGYNPSAMGEFSASKGWILVGLPSGLQGQIVGGAGKDFQEAGTALCKGLEAGKLQKHAENRESKYPLSIVQSCSAGLSWTPLARLPLDRRENRVSERQAWGWGPSQINELFLLPTRLPARTARTARLL